MPDLNDGETAEIKGSAAKPYVLRNVGGVYSCTCPAWRNQSTAIERRTCKHLRKFRGEAAEQARIGAEAVAPSQANEEKEASDGPPLLLAQSWDNAMDLVDWWMSEKLDGVRAYWDGSRFLSRQGNVFFAPDWFVEGLPDKPLDGELWIARKSFQRTVSVVRRQDKSDHWREVRYLVFDAPVADGGFEERLAFLKDSLHGGRTPFAAIHEHQRCTGITHLQEELARVEALQGEGLMLRQPGSKYEVGRSSTLLKIKTFHDAEALVVGHQPGKGKHKGKLGALVARLEDGTEFSIGTGFSDAQRAAPPPIGSKVTFRYQEFSDGGVPRFPSFVRLFETSPLNAAKLQNGEERTAESPQVASSTSAKLGRAKAKPPTDSGPIASAVSNGMKRYFEFVEGTSSKFWEITVAGNQVTVRYGRIGSDGVRKPADFADPSAALSHAETLVAEKLRKGYVEKTSMV